MGAPLLGSGGSPFELGLSASVLPTAMACGRGQAALRSNALSSPAWRWADDQCHNVKFGNCQWPLQNSTCIFAISATHRQAVDIFG
jgi:hypothetical protein